VEFCPGITGEKPMRKPRRNHSAKFKAQVALEAIRGEKTIAEIAAHHEVHPTQVTSWKNEVLEKLVGIFGGENSSRDEKERIRELHAKIGELTVEREFLEGALGKFPGLSGKR
jgi:transposase